MDVRDIAQRRKSEIIVVVVVVVVVVVLRVSGFGMFFVSITFVLYYE